MVTITISVDGTDVHALHVTTPTPAGNVPNAKRKPAGWLSGMEFNLTDRQIDVARLAATGMQYKQIAVELGISERTVRSHITDIFERTGLHSNTMLVAWVWLMGLLTEDDIIRTWRDIAPHLVELA